MRWSKPVKWKGPGFHSKNSLFYRSKSKSVCLQSNHVYKTIDWSVQRAQKQQPRKTRILHLFEWTPYEKPQAKWVKLFPPHAKKKTQTFQIGIDVKKKNAVQRRNGNRFTWNCIIGFVCNKTTRFWLKETTNMVLYLIYMATISFSTGCL